MTTTSVALTVSPVEWPPRTHDRETHGLYCSTCQRIVDGHVSDDGDVAASHNPKTLRRTLKCASGGGAMCVVSIVVLNELLDAWLANTDTSSLHKLSVW